MAKKLRSVLRTVIAVPTFFVFTLLMSAVAIVLLLVRPNSPQIERVIQIWSYLFLTIAPIRHETIGREKVDTSRQYVFVSNHLSNFDIPLLFRAIPVPIRYLAKKELFQIPILAPAMRRVGIVEIDRQAGTAVHKTINEGIRAAVARGHSLIIFPEAHRSEDQGMQRFKKGAFRIAIDNGLPIVPVTIHGTWEVWPPGTKVIYPGQATVVFHEVIETDGMERADIDGLLERTRNVIGESYEDMLRLAARGPAQS